LSNVLNLSEKAKHLVVYLARWNANQVAKQLVLLVLGKLTTLSVEPCTHPDGHTSNLRSTSNISGELVSFCRALFALHQFTSKKICLR
jgi:hypothetical protein